MKTIKYYRITNATTGHDFGIFGGVDEAEAIDLMLDDAGVGPDASSGLDEIKASAVETVTEDDIRVVADLRTRYGYDA